MTSKADIDVNARYGYMRNRFGDQRPQANGYRLGSFFNREQQVLLNALRKDDEPILDAACGSGLMLAPLVPQERQIIGLDFNEDACLGAQGNGIFIIRGDAFNIPLATKSVGQIVNCQFLNQQPTDKTKLFIEECARVLQHDGRLIILWRHAQSMVHKSAHSIFTFLDKFSGQPEFPQHTHPIEEIKNFAENANLEVEQEAVTLPFFKRDTIPVDSLWANIIGASLFIILRKK